MSLSLTIPQKQELLRLGILEVLSSPESSETGLTEAELGPALAAQGIRYHTERGIALHGAIERAVEEGLLIARDRLSLHSQKRATNAYFTTPKGREYLERGKITALYTESHNTESTWVGRVENDVVIKALTGLLATMPELAGLDPARREEIGKSLAEGLKARLTR